MPINKDALKRFRIIDRLLSDPNHDYTTDDILRAVNRSCTKVSLRMIQKDILAINEEFGKELERNKGGRGTVRYADQSQPVFYQELTSDEEEVLREVLASLGQFDGLDNFTWLDLLKKKLQYKPDEKAAPLISFSKNEGLQIPQTLLGRLFTAISRRKVIRITYRAFGGIKKEHTVYPYQLKQFNDRWFLLCTPLATEEFPYRPEFIATFALDRMEGKFEYVEEEPYIDCPVDFEERFNQIIGVTLKEDAEVEEVIFAVKKGSLPYVQTKFLHNTQIQIDGEWEESLRVKYPKLGDCTFFSIECRPNHELYSRFASYSDQMLLLEPVYMREELRRKMEASASNYKSLD